MKLNSIKFKNFRIHKDTEIELDKINVFVGSNGGGKSSIKDGIQYAFTGKNRLTDGRGSGAEVMINWDASQAEITLDIDSIGELKRVIPNDLQVVDWKGSKTAQEEELFDQLGVDERVIEAVLNSYNYIQMDSSEQKDLLFDLAGLNFDKDKIIDEYIKYNDGEIDKAAKLLKEELDDNISGGGEVFSDVYKTVYDLRWKAKKQLSKAKSNVKEIPEHDLPQKINPDDKPEIKKQFKEMKNKRDKLVEKIGETKSKIEQKSKLEEKLKEQKEALDNIENDYTDDSIDELKENVKNLEDDLEKNNEKLEKLRTDKSDLKSEIDGKKQAIESLNRENKACPLAPEHVECPMSNEEIEDLIENIKNDIEEDNLEDLEDEIGELLNSIRDINQELSAMKNIIDLKEGIKNIEKDLEELEIDKKPEQLQKEIDKLDKRIKNGRELIEKIEKYQEYHEREEDLEKEVIEKEKRVRALEKLVSAFKPEGIKNSLIDSIIEPIEKEANKQLERLTDGLFNIKFNLDNDKDQFLEVKKENWPQFAPTKVLSTSEKLRVGIVLQHVLNSLTDLNFLVIDEADTLEPKNKSMLVNTVLQIEDKYDQIMILSTIGEKKPRNPGIENLSTYWIEDGNVTTI